MFHRFSDSARSLVTRAVQVAGSERGNSIDPKHLLIALIEQHPGLFEKACGHSIDLQAIQNELIGSETHLPSSGQGGKLKFNKEGKQVLMQATEQARWCWERWEAPRRKGHHVLPEDLEYWEARLRQPLRNPRFSGRFNSWVLRRKWEVDERHLLLGLLEGPIYVGLAILRERGMTAEVARQRLCARVDTT